jgi:hypothetical protein
MIQKDTLCFASDALQPFQEQFIDFDYQDWSHYRILDIPFAAIGR